MSRTTKGSKPLGYEFWSRRYPHGGAFGYGPVCKKITKKYERRQGKAECREHMQ